MEVTLQLHTPMPNARKLAPLRFSTPQTSLVVATSVQRGFESCQIGFPVRDGEIVRPAMLPNPVLEYQDYGHVTVADGAARYFVGRAASQPLYTAGELRGITALGYWDALNDGYYESSDATATTSGVVIRAILNQLVPYVQIDEANWNDPAIAHARNEFDGQRGGSAIDSLLREGTADGTPVDLQFWCDQNGTILARLLSRTPPAVPDLVCDWAADTQLVSLSYDPTQLYSHVRARYTPSGGSETVSGWTPDLTDTTFEDAFGFRRYYEISAGQKTQVGAEQLRDTTQALQSQRQWGGTIRFRPDFRPLRYGGNRPVLNRELRAGLWLQVRGLEPWLQIQQCVWHVTEDVAELTVSQGVTQRTLQQRIVETTDAVRTGRNPVSGAKAV